MRLCFIILSHCEFLENLFELQYIKPKLYFFSSKLIIRKFEPFYGKQIFCKKLNSQNHMEKGKMNTSDSSGMEHIERENPEAETGSK
jgi:hypothetical protein